VRRSESIRGLTREGRLAAYMFGHSGLLFPCSASIPIIIPHDSADHRQSSESTLEYPRVLPPSTSYHSASVGSKNLLIGISAECMNKNQVLTVLPAADGVRGLRKSVGIGPSARGVCNGSYRRSRGLFPPQSGILNVQGPR
jgi:hypothetical protein